MATSLQTFFAKDGLIPCLLTLWRTFSPRRRTQYVLLIGLMFVGALAEVISVGAVLPFLGILAAPDAFLKYKLAQDLMQTAGITSPQELVLPLTILFVSAAILAGALRLLLLWAQTKLTFAAGS
ncbi:MAG: ABC transporter ATP-binding protein, partial [Alphaproteobacteria bacterium]|nr:ABC transporter ATP-binding protein [Alphaproteobacteria bacterium]